jgi:hypothetical protein
MSKKSKNQLSLKTKTLMAALSIGLFAVANPNAQAATEALTSEVQTQANGEFVFKYLAAEVAGQRGELGLSTKLFFDRGDCKIMSISVQHSQILTQIGENHDEIRNFV